MIRDTEIGRVVAIDTAQVKIQLNSDLKGMVRSTYESSEEVGRINSYVIIPVGVRRLVAMVTRVVLREEYRMTHGQGRVTLPSAQRLMEATLIGTIHGFSFHQGVSVFPVLDNSVELVQRADLDIIFSSHGRSSEGHPDPDNPGYCIPIGESTAVDHQPVQIDPDALFGKHTAIIGSTGSGKSCTIASLLQSIHDQSEIRRTTCVILDTNGEYRSAFQAREADGSWKDTGSIRTRYVPSDPTLASDRLTIPYWFMSSDDFSHLFLASKGVQRPVLLEALRLARNGSDPVSQLSHLRDDLFNELRRILAVSNREEKNSKEIQSLASGLKRFLAGDQLKSVWKQAETEFELSKDDVLRSVNEISLIAAKHIDNRKYPKILPADARKGIRDLIDPICDKLSGRQRGYVSNNTMKSADTPSYFEKSRFRSRYIEDVLWREGSGGARAREYTTTMLLRIDRLLADRRFEFLFGPVGEEMPNLAHVLAMFFRDVLGIDTCNPLEVSPNTRGSNKTLPFYDRQRDERGQTERGGADVVILDLSLLAGEVLENVTALIGRLILEFLQRIDENYGQSCRGSLPVVLVLEEAQNYIKQRKRTEDESISRVVFERIAREGRKYGLGLLVASQRPSELSKTVLSQCSSFIVHRLQNPEDLRYFREIVPAGFAPLLDQVSTLESQTALVLGECVAAPSLVKIRKAEPVPKSRNPLFYRYWVGKDDSLVDVEKVCARWERSEEQS